MNTLQTHQDLAVFAQLRRLLDILAILTCFVLCHRWYLDNFNMTSERFLVMLFTVVVAHIVLNAGRIYRHEVGRRLTEETARLLLCWALVVLTVGLFAFLSKLAEEVSRVWFSLSMTSSFFVLFAYRAALRYLMFWLRKNRNQFTSVVIVGGGDTARKACAAVLANASAGYRVEGIFDDNHTGATGSAGTVTTLGRTEDLYGYIETRRRQGLPVSQVWIALPMTAEPQIVDMIQRLSDSSVGIYLIPSRFAISLIGSQLGRVGDLPVASISDLQLPHFGEWYKTIFDYTFSVCALIVLLPLMALIALAIKLESRGPVLFRQRRYGINGQEIEVWKFRTMNVLENGREVRQAQRDDQRITTVGRFLRRTSLDELPQFFNVLQGTMSIVGPRPHATSHNEQYRGVIDGYMLRHTIKPGITGLAQVKGWRGETDTIEKMEKRVHFDLKYIRHWSPWLDIKIVFLTLFKGLGGRNVY